MPISDEIKHDNTVAHLIVHEVHVNHLDPLAKVRKAARVQLNLIQPLQEETVRGAAVTSQAGLAQENLLENLVPSHLIIQCHMGSQIVQSGWSSSWV